MTVVVYGRCPDCGKPEPFGASVYHDTQQRVVPCKMRLEEAAAVNDQVSTWRKLEEAGLADAVATHIIRTQPVPHRLLQALATDYHRGERRTKTTRLQQHREAA
jgi:hypothetical protein